MKDQISEFLVECFKNNIIESANKMGVNEVSFGKKDINIPKATFDNYAEKLLEKFIISEK